MDAAEEEVDAEVGDDDAEEGQGAVEEEFLRFTADGERGVQGEGVDDECDECPDLLGVPGPVVAPRDVGPQGTDDNAEGEQEHSGVKETFRQVES